MVKEMAAANFKHYKYDPKTEEYSESISVGDMQSAMRQLKHMVEGLAGVRNLI
jgi:hypothetical protein